MEEYSHKVVIVTGGANGIGKCIVDEFRKRGASVYVIDKAEGPHYVGDIAFKDTLEAFASEVLKTHVKIDYIINNVSKPIGNSSSGIISWDWPRGKP